MFVKKYVRLEDRIVDTSKYPTRVITKIYDKEYHDKLGLTIGDTVIMIDGNDVKVTEGDFADDVEKLCDEIFFVDEEDNFPHSVNRFNPYLDEDKKLTECRLEIGGWVCWLKDYQKQHKGKIKGAIYTEKGIIYVTEMNEQGDWQLL